MIDLRDLPPDAARAAIREGDFPAEIVGAPKVAVVMTQNWCPDWFIMKAWLSRQGRNGDPSESAIIVYVFVYNQSDLFFEFMQHKEQVFGNHLIPYVRYYSHGELIDESNAVGKRGFVGRFKEVGNQR